MPARGLSHADARARLDQYGPNALPEAEIEPWWRRLARQFRSPLIHILLVALTIDLIVWAAEGRHGFPFEAVAIGVILALNAGLGAVQEHKAEAALARLADLAAPQVWTLRDGALIRIPSRELVPGDVIRLDMGDRVPADGTVRATANAAADEAVVTGESLPVEKVPGADVLAGTLIVRGSAYVEVTRTGSASTMGQLAAMLSRLEAEPTPLERRLHTLGRQISRWVLVLAGGIAVVGLAVEGLREFAPVFLLAVALAVAAVPEGLPAVLTVTLALGVERMARRRAVVRKLAAVEALGSVTVIATDKTGTLTSNRLEVHALDATRKDEALRAMVLANDAETDHEAGDPLELALVAFAAREGIDVARERAGSPRISSRPFDSAAKFMRATVRRPEGTVSYVKGAPETLLDAARLPPAARRELEEMIARRAAEGYRLLGLARGEGETERDLEWLGLVALWDPPRAEVAEAVREARAAGIRVLMLTGDHPDTARTVARTVGLEAGTAMTGAEVEALDDPGLRAAVQDASLFARVTPEHKLRIVEALQANGEIVAMTGDGVNDAPALKRADVGIAMGQRGSDVSREVADLVLLDDNFATIVAAIEEGRSIYENIQKFIRFLLSTNLSEVLVVTTGAFAALLLGIRTEGGELLLPLTAAQLLWINLVTDGAPALALGLDRNPGVMRRPPRDPRQPLLDSASLRFVGWSGAAKAMVALTLLAGLPVFLGESIEATRTAVFVFMATGQLLFAYPARHTDLLPPPNPVMHLAVAGSLALQLLVVSVPGIMTAFNAVPLGWDTWLAVAVAAAIAWAAADLVSRTLWRPDPAQARR